MQLELEIQSLNGYAVVTARGEIDLATNPELKETIGDLLVDAEIHLVIDLTEVTFIDSTGLGALIGGRRKAQGFKGSFSLVCTSDRLLKLFRITSLDTVFKIYPTLAEATATPATPLDPDPDPHRQSV